jgi:hypothetical protein
MSAYENRFKRLLIEKDKDLTDDQSAMAQTLDQGTQVSDFDVPNAPEVGAQAMPTMSSIQKQMHEELKQWTLKINDFINFINSPDASSIQSKLNAAEAQTLYDKIKNAETKKIARVAGELATLNQQLMGYLATSNDPKYKYS